MIRSYRAILKEDFEATRQLLLSKGRWPRLSPDLEGTARRMHHLAYSLILWQFRLEHRQLPGHRFLVEIASDAVQVLPQCLDAYPKTPLLLMRGCLEHATRYVYFADHPIELERLDRSEFWISPSDLMDYLKKHPAFVDQEPQSRGIEQLTNSYAELSEHLHASKWISDSVILSIAELELDTATFKAQARIFERACSAVNYLLATHHALDVRRLLLAERQIVLRSLPKATRRALASSA